MGLLDNLKNRLGLGGRAEDMGEYDDYEYDSYHDAYHDAYHDSLSQVYASQSDGDADDGIAYDQHSSAHTPLVNMTDIRSQPIQLSRGAGSREDRIPMPVIRERRSAGTVSGLAADDSEAFRDSLARSPQNSLVQLHSERIQLEAAVPEFDVPKGTGARHATVASLASAGASGVVGAREPYRPSSAANRGNAGAVTPRGTRTTVVLRPQSYADAEQISVSLRQGEAVALDLTSVRPELAKRILDFSFGATSAFEGQVDRFADRVYILTRNGSLSDDEKSRIRL